MKAKDKHPGGRPPNWLIQAIKMEVMCAHECCQRTAEMKLAKHGWDYHQLVKPHVAKTLDDFPKLSEFDKGRHIGILQQLTGDMKDKKGLV
jgi:hypothetical protein